MIGKLRATKKFAKTCKTKLVLFRKEYPNNKSIIIYGKYKINLPKSQLFGFLTITQWGI